MVGVGVAAAPHIASGEELRVGHSFSSTTDVHLLVLDPDARLLGTVPEQADLQLHDESGEPVQLRGATSGFGSYTRAGLTEMPTIAADRTAMQLTFTAPGTPSEGARELRLRGTLSVIVGGARASATGAVELREGETLVLGTVELRVRRVQPLPSDPTKLSVTFEALGGLASVGGLEDITASSNGQPLRIEPRGQSVWGVGEDARAQVEYLLDRTDVERLEMRATYVTDRRVIDIPIDLAFGVGL